MASTARGQAVRRGRSGGPYGRRMSARFAELDWVETPMGEISLRRRADPQLNTDVYEVKLGDEFLMSSLFTVAEIELARLGLAAVTGGHLDGFVVGLGYTARAVLEDPRVQSLTVVEALQPVIGWHERELLPFAAGLTSDPRTTMAHHDFFALVRDGWDRRFHAVLVDIDHSPRHVLHPSHADLYTVDGLRRVAALLQPEGAFALWSDDPPDDEFTTVLAKVFREVAAHVVTFANPLTGGESANTVYVAR